MDNSLFVLVKDGQSRPTRYETDVELPAFRVWGNIPDCLAPFPQTAPVKSGPITVTTGNRSYGWEHVREKHADNIAKLHPKLSLEDYVLDVLKHYQQIYRQPDGSLWLIRDNGHTKCAVVREAADKEVMHYELITAYPLIRKPNFAKRGALRLRYTE